ncbi:flagellar export apparatus protein FliQ [Zobellella denitrificans]|uniref:Flagellar biosynthesis protein FliQ n=1 Tax=Zobellella denitrificans TaxID=347534 RepID=A0A231MVL6_9GAMM|nr:flagellar biosynthetic protein FliQ [Zobellella denitrificans]ATG74980.1 flagellar biosynthesis protein FliQ [Zobellella denitrificans]OXS14059.1 flagellar export apparatus protein FliQ [Zobellella denitrificans]
MTPEQTVDLIGQAVLTIIAMVSVLIIPGMVVGLVVSIIQSATQIQEQTLSFFPRLLITLLMLVFAGHWLLRQVMELFDQLFLMIPGTIG